MSDLISRQAAIDVCRAPHMRNADCSDFEMAIMMLPSAELSTNLAEVGTELISRQAALDIFDDYNVAVENGQIEAYSHDRKRLCDLPSAQPDPPEECERCMMEHTDEMEKLEVELAMAQPKRGRWISADAIFGGVPFYCSECGENTRDTVVGKPRWNFCPNCGAKMEGVSE